MEPNTNEPIINETELKMPEGSYGSMAPEKPSYLGIILGALIIILVLLLGGLYLWSSSLEPLPTTDTANTRPTAEENNEPESTNAEADAETAGALSTSNELDAIEADLGSTNLDTLDADVLTIDETVDMEVTQ